MTEADGMVFVVYDDPAMRALWGNLLRSVVLRVEVFASAQDLLGCNSPECLLPSA
jgi:FixJ family two-component response regulator